MQVKGVNKEVIMWKTKCEEISEIRTKLESGMKDLKQKLIIYQSAPPPPPPAALAPPDLAPPVMPGRDSSMESLPAKTGCCGTRARAPKSSVRAPP